MTCLVLFSLLLLAMETVYVAVATGSRKAVETAVMFAIAAVLAAFLFWFVVFGPRPAYLPPYGTDPQDLPHQMRD